MKTIFINLIVILSTISFAHSNTLPTLDIVGKKNLYAHMAKTMEQKQVLKRQHDINFWDVPDIISSDIMIPLIADSFGGVEALDDGFIKEYGLLKSCGRFDISNENIFVQKRFIEQWKATLAKEIVNKQGNVLFRRTVPVMVEEYDFDLKGFPIVSTDTSKTAKVLRVGERKMHNGEFWINYPRRKHQLQKYDSRTILKACYWPTQEGGVVSRLETVLPWLPDDWPTYIPVSDIELAETVESYLAKEGLLKSTLDYGRRGRFLLADMVFELVEFITYKKYEGGATYVIPHLVPVAMYVWLPGDQVVLTSKGQSNNIGTLPSSRRKLLAVYGNATTSSTTAKPKDVTKLFY